MPIIQQSRPQIYKVLQNNEFLRYMFFGLKNTVQLRDPLAVINASTPTHEVDNVIPVYIGISSREANRIYGMKPCSLSMSFFFEANTLKIVETYFFGRDFTAARHFADANDGLLKTMGVDITGKDGNIESYIPCSSSKVIFPRNLKERFNPGKQSIPDILDKIECYYTAYTGQVDDLIIGDNQG